MYLYLDAAYLRRAMANRLASVGIADASPNWLAVARHFRAERTFFYDCLDTVAKPGESPESLNERISTEEAAAKRVGLLDGFFLRLGSQRGAPGKARQKEVDVLLAVDMMIHAHRQASPTVTLLAGDLDFKPVVDAVVELGVKITVAFESKSGSLDLAMSADRRQLLTLFELWRMSDKFVEGGTEQISMSGHGMKWYGCGDRLLAADSPAGRIYLCEGNEGWVLDLSELQGYRECTFWSSKDKLLLMSFPESDFGSLDWRQIPSGA